MSSGKYIGLVLALSSNAFIGVSYIITKRALIKSDGHGKADSHSYLKNYLWWLGTLTMVCGELANFAAYSFAPALLITPLGALSVILSAVLASIFLNEKLQAIGKAGCALCILGSTIIVLHAPEETPIESVNEILEHVASAGFILYSLLAVGLTLYLIYYASPRWGRTHVIVYIGICSLMGSLTVMASKGFGIALKLTFAGQNQFVYPSTYFFILTTVSCILVQLNYFNKALDMYSTAIVTPIYYVFFTTATIIASVLLYGSTITGGVDQALSPLAGFCIIFIGVYLLSKDKQDHIEYKTRARSVESMMESSKVRKTSGTVPFQDFTIESLGFDQNESRNHLFGVDE